MVHGMGRHDTYCASDLFFKELFQVGDYRFYKNMYTTMYVKGVVS
jgi:hypothetical protein